ncbi:hypothetical protein BHE74_00058511 [Ensete ventricosum]|uniref:Uncharacterized protein n=1 Tax=Ensete ventricosum TaxID=4639 RepID=A0A426XNZ6_ENSVE|nr:hypothetical protein B296_00057980 [Ensete ventricosum]RWW36464.1 hypothetical protein BHE74_00058511 [Ensete ventricosum]RZS28667.1 hypothetical protein BHM03_00062293 [Ensete ventricosum]
MTWTGGMEKPRSEAMARASAMPPSRLGAFFPAPPVSPDTDISAIRSRSPEAGEEEEDGEGVVGVWGGVVAVNWEGNKELSEEEEETGQSGYGRWVAVDGVVVSWEGKTADAVRVRKQGGGGGRGAIRNEEAVGEAVSSLGFLCTAVGR